MSETFTEQAYADIREWRAAHAAEYRAAKAAGDEATVTRLSDEADALMKRLGQSQELDEVMSGDDDDDETEEEPTNEAVAAAAARLKAEANGAAPAAPAAPAEKKVPKYVAVMVNADQYEAIEKFANGKALSGVCLQILADTIGFKVLAPAKPARQKYDTPEERKAAAAARAKTKNAALNEFLALHAAEFEKLMAAKAAELAAAVPQAVADGRAPTTLS